MLLAMYGRNHQPKTKQDLRLFIMMLSMIKQIIKYLFSLKVSKHIIKLLKNQTRHSEQFRD